MTNRKQVEDYVREELRRRIKPSLLRMADNPVCGQDLAAIFVDILETMTKKEPS